MLCKLKRIFFGMWYLPIFVVFTIISGSIAIVGSYFSKNFSRYVTSQIWAHVVMDPAAISVTVTGREHLPPPESGGFIIFANHRSLLDIPTVAKATNRRISWVAKAALGRIPFFGWSLMRVHMLVDRGGGAEAAKKMLKEASERLTRGEIMAIFPEGTRNRGEEFLLPFKKGAFILAKHTGVPLVPLAIANSGNLWPSGRYLPHSGQISVAIGPPVPVGAEDSLKAIADRAYVALEELGRDIFNKTKAK